MHLSYEEEALFPYHHVRAQPRQKNKTVSEGFGRNAETEGQNLKKTSSKEPKAKKCLSFSCQLI